jgi:hypothetical protein
MTKRNQPTQLVKGKADIFYINALNGRMHHSGITDRVLPSQLEKYLNAKASFAFIANTNLHNLPAQCRGVLCVIWDSGSFRLAIVVKASSDTMQCTFLIQKRMERFPQFLSWTGGFFNVDTPTLRLHFLVKTFHLSTIFCRTVNQIHGVRTTLIHPSHVDLKYPPICMNDYKISMREEGPDICYSPGSNQVLPLIRHADSNLLDDPAPQIFQQSKKNSSKLRKKYKVPVLYVKDNPYRTALVCTCHKVFAPNLPRDKECKWPTNKPPIKKRAFIGIPIPLQYADF